MATLTLHQAATSRTSFQDAETNSDEESVSEEGYIYYDEYQDFIYGIVHGNYSLNGNSWTGSQTGMTKLDINGNAVWTLEGISSYSYDYYALGYSRGYEYYSADYLKGNDKIIGSSGNDYIHVSLGTDTIDGGAGTDTLSFNNNISYGDKSLTVNLSTNSYKSTYSSASHSGKVSSVENVIGSSTDDYITGDKNNNVIDGRNGDDIIDGGAGTDTISYATKNLYSNYYIVVDLSKAEGGYGYASSGYYSAQETDTLMNIENIEGSHYSDILTGDAKNNVIMGGLGYDNIDGGAGVDTADYAKAVKAVTANLSTGKATGEGTDTLTNIENLSGSKNNDTLTGNTDNNLLSGNAGNDTLFGDFGNDTLNGGDGNDTLFADMHNDLLDGGSGIDTLSFTKISTAVMINLSKTTAQNTNVGNDTIKNIENVIGGTAADTITGSAIANQLEGGSGNDILVGNEGNDTMIGGIGVDKLTGGAGNDIFTYLSTKELNAKPANSDTITDFTRGQDKINLSAIDADAADSAKDKFVFVGTSLQGNAGEVAFSKGMVMIDTVGVGFATSTITLTGLTTLSSSDFIF